MLTAALAALGLGAGFAHAPDLPAAQPNSTVVPVELRELLANGVAPQGFPAPATWEDVRTFYARRADAPAWIEGTTAGPRVDEAIGVLRTAEQHGLRSAEYGVSDLERDRAGFRELEAPASRRLADFDVRMTAALLSLGYDVAHGRTEPEVDPQLRPARRSPDLPETLAEAVSGRSVSSWLARVQPPHTEYAALSRALADLLARANSGAWPAVPATLLNSRGDDSAELRRRLDASGDPSVESFQYHHGLEPTGTIDRATLAALNLPIGDRIHQLGVNLERWRWMPADLGSRHIVVNIPGYSLAAREDGRTVLEMRVIVGKRGNETPAFSQTMTHVVFSPYWNIPETIVSNETLPALAKDPAYLARQNIEVLRGAGGGHEIVDPSSLDWSDVHALKKLSFRQRPGSSNALGLVKFMFPNPFNVYIHDTPTASLFRRMSRAFSHGCVRIQEPARFANYVLRDQPQWTPEAIGRAMHAGTEQHVRLSSPIPVHIVYFTAWVDERGGLHFRDDVYGYDRKQRAHPAEYVSKTAVVGGKDLIG